MYTPDRCTKTLLLLLVVGIWALVLRPVLHGDGVKAQDTGAKNFWRCTTAIVPAGSFPETMPRDVPNSDGWEPFAVYYLPEPVPPNMAVWCFRSRVPVGTLLHDGK